MKKKVERGALISSFVIFLLTIDLMNLIMRFIAVGELPGGFTIISADAMLFITVAALGFVVEQLVSGAAKYLKLSQVASPKLPKRRYTTQ